MKRTLHTILFLAMGLMANAQAQNYPNGSTVANFSVTDLNGVTHTLQQYTSAGKFVMLDFWFYNCGPCRAVAPYYSQLYETYGCNSADLVCLSVNTGVDSDALVGQFAVEFGGPYAHPPAIGSGGGGSLTNTFGVQATPTVVLISPNNVMLANDIWPISNMQTFVNAFPAGSNIQPAACALSVNDAAMAIDMRAYPSPTNGPLQVSMDLPGDRQVSLQLVDALGREAGTWQLGRRGAGSFTETLDLSGLVNGTYLLRALADEGHAATWRVVVAH